jgi:cytochrome c553
MQQVRSDRYVARRSGSCSARSPSGVGVGAFALALAIGLACAGPKEPQIQTGPDAIVTGDGLHRVDRVPHGTLFMKRDYAFGTYEKFFLGETVVLIKPGARVLDRDEVESVKARFDAVARQAIAETGRTEVAERGPCVAAVYLALLNLDLADNVQSTGARTTMMDSFGEVTLVLDIRDGHTDEPLLRYAGRRSLGGGFGVGTDPAKGAALTATFRKFADDFQSDFTRALPRVAPTSRTLTCEQRAGLEPFTPDVDARRELEEALRLSPDRAAGERIYASCAGCHQSGGEGLPDGSVPRLAGQHWKVVLKQLADIRAGNRDNPTMYSFAYESRIGGPQGVADVADYIRSLEMRGAAGTGSGEDLELGERVYASRCARCHGPDGRGDGDRYIPRIESQHYGYLVRQFQSIKDGRRQNADPEMAALAAELEPREVVAVLDYLSRLDPPDGGQSADARPPSEPSD